MYRQTERRIGGKKDRKMERQVRAASHQTSQPGRHPDKQTERLRDRQTGRQTDSKTYLPCLTQACEIRMV